MKKIIYILFIVLIVFSISVVSASDANTTDNLTESEPVKVNGNTFNDIQKTVDKSTAGDVVELEGVYTGNKKAININKDLTVQGSKNGATLNANKLSSVFSVNAANVCFKDLTIINSLDSSIENAFDEKMPSRDITIINCTFKSNGGGWDGGIIFSSSEGTLTVINSTFENNKADFGGAIYSVSGNLNIINSKFTNNIASYEGGAIYFTGNRLNVVNTSFSSNTAKKEDGGAIKTSFDSTTSNILNSTFNKNYAYYGGAICSSANLTVKHSEFISNTAKNDGGSIYAQGNLIILNSNFNGCSAGGNGNSVFATFCDADIENSKFNSASYQVYIKPGYLKNVNNNLKHVKVVETLKATLSSNKFVTTYDSRDLFTVQAKSGSSYVFDVNIKIKVYTGSTYKVFKGYIWEDDYGAYFSISKLSLGTHKVKIYLDNKYYSADPIKVKIKINQAKTSVKAKKVTAKYKKSKNFNVKVKNKASGKVVKNLKLKIKVYTGKKFKKYTVKTNKKGTVSINTKKLKKGLHKVVITSKNKNYSVSKKSSIKIK